MSARQRWPRLPSDVGGHGIIEVTVALMLLSLVLGSAYGVLVAQHRFYARNNATAAARDAARIAVQVLAAELRGASPAAGDLYAIAADSLALRSTTAVAVICEISGNSLRLRRLTGAFGDRQADSALVFLDHDTLTVSDDEWAAVGAVAVQATTTGTCPGGRPADLSLVVDGPVGGAVPGAPVRGFRPYVYKLYAGPSGNWWLGQRLRSGVVQPLAGPFAEPGSGGLQLEYLTAAGTAAREPDEVVQVRIRVRALSRWPGPSRAGGAPAGVSLSTAVMLRNS